MEIDVVRLNDIMSDVWEAKLDAARAEIKLDKLWHKLRDIERIQRKDSHNDKE